MCYAASERLARESLLVPRLIASVLRALILIHVMLRRCFKLALIVRVGICCGGDEMLSFFVDRWTSSTCLC